MLDGGDNSMASGIRAMSNNEETKVVVGEETRGQDSTLLKLLRLK